MRLGIASWLVGVASVVVLVACGSGGADGDVSDPSPDTAGVAEVAVDAASGTDAQPADGANPRDTAVPADTAEDAEPGDAGVDQATGPDAHLADAADPDATDAVTPPPDCWTTGCGPTATCTAGPDGVPACACNAGYQDDGQG